MPWPVRAGKCIPTIFCRYQSDNGSQNGSRPLLKGGPTGLGGGSVACGWVG